MEEAQKPDGPNQKEQDKKKQVLIIMAVIIAIIAGLLVYNYLDNQRLEEEKAAQEAEIERMALELDSISNELNDKIITISQLGGEIDTLMKIKERLEEERRDFRTRAFRQINDLQEKVSGYKELLQLQDVEIEKLKEINAVLMEENTTLKTEKNQLSDSIRGISKSKTQLEEQVALASQLKIEDLRIFALNDRGKEREKEFRNRHIDKLRIDFAIAENAVAPIEGKEIKIRIIDPDRNVLFDVSRGSGSFMFEGREMFYTAQQEILYDRQRQQMSFFYDKGSEYKLGQHKVEVYAENYLMGESTFTVK